VSRAKDIRRAMMLAKLPPAGPALQELQRLAVSQPVDPVQSAMGLVQRRSGFAYGGMPDFSYPAFPNGFQTFQPRPFTPVSPNQIGGTFRGGADSWAPASGYPIHPVARSPATTRPTTTSQTTGGNEGMGGYRRRGQSASQTTGATSTPLNTPASTDPGTAEGNATNMGAVSIGQGPVGPNGMEMGPGMMGLSYGLATGQTPSIGYGLASLGTLGLGPAGLAVSLFGNAMNALGAKGDEATDAATMAGPSKGGTDFGDPASPASISSSLSGDAANGNSDNSGMGMAGAGTNADVAGMPGGMYGGDLGGVDAGAGAAGAAGPGADSDAGGGGPGSQGDSGQGGEGGGGGGGAGGEGEAGGMYARGGAAPHNHHYSRGFLDGVAAAHQRLLQDQYPTHYLPKVGRQVMADGGDAEMDDVVPFDPSHIFQFAAGGAVAKALALVNAKKKARHVPSR